MSQYATDQAAGMPDGMPSPTRVTVEEAARLLGVSGNAVRKRLERGTLRSEKVDDVRYVLLLDNDMPQAERHADRDAGGMPTDTPSDIVLMQAHLDSMREQLDYLKTVIEIRDEEIRRKDHLLAAALERIPAIEPPETRGGHETASEDGGRVDTGEPEREPQKRSWWQRFFGFE